MEKENKIPVTKQEKEENGQNKCPKCGSTEISNIPQTDQLICNFCRHKFAVNKILRLCKMRKPPKWANNV